MIYAFDLYLLNYSNNVTRPIGYDFADFPSFPLDTEIYEALREKYSVLKDGSKQYDLLPKLLHADDSPIIGFNFEHSGGSFRLIVNNVRPIGKVKDKDKYLL